MVAFELRIVVFTVEVSAFKMIGSFGDVNYQVITM